MGEMIRAKDWSQTSLGNPEDWPLSLRILVPIMFENTHGMYIAWGEEYIQLYNDCYRSILGTTKHPQALGISARKTFPEIWNTITGPMFEEVMTGKAVGFSDFLVSMNRYGYLEDCYFDFSCVPILKEDGEVGGILATVIETTNKKKAEVTLKESEQRFRDTVQQAPVGMSIIRRKDYIVEMANDAYMQLIDREVTAFVGKPLFESLPEVQESIQALLDGVLNTGIPFHGNEIPIPLNRNGKQEIGYFDFLYYPLKEEDEGISGIIVTATEVTEKVMSRKKIEESEQCFQAAIEAVQGILWTNNGQGEMEGEQFGWASLTGQTYEEYQGYGWAKAVHPDDAQPTVEAWNEAIREGKPFIFEHRIKVANGQWRHFSIRSIPIVDTDGNLSQWVGVHTDITAQKLAEEKLAYRTTLLEAHTEANVDGVLLVDAKGKIISFNQRFVELWNMPSHIVEANDDEAALSFAMTQLINPQQFIDKVKYLYEHPTETSLDELEFKDGKIIERNGYPVVGKDSIYYAWSWTFRDITEQKKYEKTITESEQKFRLLADSMPQFIWTSNPEGNLNYFNQSVFNYSGLTIEQINQDGWIQIVHPDDREENIKKWTDSITTGKDFLFEHRFRRHDGTYHWQLSRAIPQRDNTGEIQMWVGTSTDIQDQKTFATELERQVDERTKELGNKNNELEKMNKELESFAYISSHDLQEPLRKIQTFSLRILEQEENNLSDNGKNMFLRMNKAAQRMQTLIHDLLAYSRTNSSKRKLEITDLNKIIDEIKDDLKEELKGKNATLDVYQLCVADVIPFQFRQLMLNLISNSLKFSNPENPPYIRIKSEIATGKHFNHVKLPLQSKYCHITISDNGIGFKQEYSEKIFEIFQRLHGREEYTGTGIGLSIVKKIVDNHNGIIVATGELNKGATFDIYFPTT